MNQMQIFKNQEFGQVRTLLVEEQPYFIAKDVAGILGYGDGNVKSKALANAIKDHVDEEDKILLSYDDFKRYQNGDLKNISHFGAYVINESGLYSLILGSKLPQAKEFKRWVTSEVLPTIRKNGMYATDELLDNPDLLISVATKLKEEKERNKKLEAEIEETKPKVLFSEAVENSNDLISVKEMATLITQSGFKVGQNELFEYLRKYNYLCSKRGSLYHLPTKKYERFFKVTKRTIQGIESIHVRNTPKINGKGQLYFIKKFAEYKLQGLTFKDLLKDTKEVI